MAMDSALKRKAAAGTARPWMRSQGNDAAVGRGWRASIGNAYPVANFVAPGGGGGFKTYWAWNATVTQSLQGMS